MTVRWALLLAAITLTATCTGAPAPLGDTEREAIAASVDSATRAFAAAERARDVERTIAHLAPEFSMLMDGVRVGYDSVVASIRRGLPSFAHFETAWTDVVVLVLSRDAAVASFTFRDSIVTRDGTLLQGHGPTTLVWQRRGRNWRITYADADHYPLVP